MTTGLDGETVLHGDTTHNHDSDRTALQTHVLRQAVKRKAETDISERPRKIIMKEAEKLTTDAVNLSGVHSARRAIWVQRRKKIEKLPSSREEAIEAITTIKKQR